MKEQGDCRTGLKFKGWTFVMKLANLCYYGLQSNHAVEVSLFVCSASAYLIVTWQSLQDSISRSPAKPQETASQLSPQPVLVPQCTTMAALFPAEVQLKAAEQFTITVLWLWVGNFLFNVNFLS